MDVGVGILFLAVLCAEIVLLPVWAAAILSISGDIVDNIIELLDLENMGIAVGILSVGVLELVITLGGILLLSHYSTHQQYAA